MTTPPYAYSVMTPCDRTRIFPMLDLAVKYLIDGGAVAGKSRVSTSLRAHVLDTYEPQEVDLCAYMEQVPVDEAAVRAELAVAVADDRVRFDKTYPHGRPPGARFSGDHWLCENSPEELEHMVAREIERRSWQWKTLS